MRKARVIKDNIDRDMMHVYVRLSASTFDRWLLAASMHGDIISELFGKEVENRVEEAGEAEILVGTHIVKESDYTTPTPKVSYQELTPEED